MTGPTFSCSSLTTTREYVGIRGTTAAILRAVGYIVISVVENLRPETPPPGIVMVSAYDVDSDLRQRLDQRVCKYLKKPVPPKDLIDAVA
jgi:CheY-like chemotaxis protein